MAIDSAMLSPNHGTTIEVLWTAFRQPVHSMRLTRSNLLGARFVRAKPGRRRLEPLVDQPLHADEYFEWSKRSCGDRHRSRHHGCATLYPRVVLAACEPVRHCRDEEYSDDSDEDELLRQSRRRSRRQKSERSHRRRRRRQDTSSSDSHSDDHRVERDHRAYGLASTADLRAQRVHSLQAMARLQRNAACVIQQEYRCYRNRRRNRARQRTERENKALEFLDQFLRDDVLPLLVSDTLLEELRERAQAVSEIRLEGESLACSIYHELVHELVYDTFQGVVDAMVKDYIVTRLDFSRSAMPPAHAVATDLVDELVVEIAAEIVPDALFELVEGYMATRGQDDLYDTLLHGVLEAVVVDAAVEVVLEDLVHQVEANTNILT